MAGLNNVLLPVLLTFVIVTMLNIIVDNCEQCWQQNTVQSCLQQVFYVDLDDLRFLGTLSMSVFCAKSGPVQ